MRFLHGLLGPRSLRLVAVLSGILTLLFTIYLLSQPRISEDFWLFYRPLADEHPPMSLVKSLFRYTTQHPIRPPYQQAYGTVGRHSALIRQWLTLAQNSDDPAVKEQLTDMAEKLAASTFPFLTERLDQPPTSQTQSQHPVAALRASFTPGSTGILIPTSDGSAHSAARLLLNLRAVLGSTLPVQIAHAGDALSTQSREFLSQIDIPGPPVEFLDINSAFNASTTRLEPDAWEAKPFAALASRYERVVVADPDVGFFQRPETIFQDEMVAQIGALLSKDRLLWYHAYRDPGDWERYIEPYVDNYTLPRKTVDQALFIVDAGLAVFDKARLDILLGLMFVCWQHSYEVRRELAFPERYGSRAVWWRGLEMTGAGYVEPDYYGGVIGWEGDGERDGERAKVCGSAVAHTDAEGRLLWWKGELSSDREINKWMIESTRPGPFSAMWEEISGTYDEIQELKSRGVYCMIADEAGSLSDEEVDILRRLIELAS